MAAAATTPRWWRRPWVPALAAACVAILANRRILGQFFFADDFANLVEVANFGPREFITAAASGHMYLVRNTILYLSFLAFRMHPTGYFVVALATHVVNVLLLFTVARRLTGRAALAGFGAVLFAMSPTNEGTLGWYAVYGHALATTFVLLALLLLVDEDDRAPVRLPRAFAIAGCTLAASQCFGTGAAAAIVFPLVASLLRPGLLRDRVSALVVWSVPAVVALAVRIMFAMQTRSNPYPAATNAFLLYFATDWPRVAPMLLHLVSVGTVTLLLGTLYPLARYPDTVSAVVTAAVVVAVAVALVRGTARDRRRLTALLLLIAASYGAIAAGRASMIASLKPNEVVKVIAHGWRYYYMGQAALTLVVCAVLSQAGRAETRAIAVRVALAGWLLCVAAGRLVSSPPHEDFEPWRRQVSSRRDAIEQEIRTIPPGGVACIANQQLNLAGGFPGSFGIFILYHRSDEFEGRRVYFTTSDPQVLALRLPGSRAESLVLPAGACPPDAASAPPVPPDRPPADDGAPSAAPH